MQSLPYARNSPKHPTVSHPVFNPQQAGAYYSDGYVQNGSLNYQPQYYIPPQMEAQHGHLRGDYVRNANSFQGGQPYFRNSPYIQVPYMQPKSLQHVEREENNERLLDLIERQTHVIGSLNTKIIYQEQKKIQQEKKELKDKLKKLEMANAMQQREIDARLRANFVSLSPNQNNNKKKFESADKIKGSRMLQMLGKLIVGNENGNQNEDPDSSKYYSPRQDDDDLYEPSSTNSRRRSKKSKTSTNLDPYY